MKNEILKNENQKRNITDLSKECNLVDLQFLPTVPSSCKFPGLFLLLGIWEKRKIYLLRWSGNQEGFEEPIFRKNIGFAEKVENQTGFFFHLDKLSQDVFCCWPFSHVRKNFLELFTRWKNFHYQYISSLSEKKTWGIKNEIYKWHLSDRSLTVCVEPHVSSRLR